MLNTFFKRVCFRITVDTLTALRANLEGPMFKVEVHAINVVLILMKHVIELDNRHDAPARPESRHA